MRVVASGNLTVELIRAQRFDVGHRLDALVEQPARLHDAQVKEYAQKHPAVDRVELSPQALASDPWAMPTERAGSDSESRATNQPEPCPVEQPTKPSRLSPVVGSPALAGLGAAWVVPGTLLDVVA